MKQLGNVVTTCLARLAIVLGRSGPRSAAGCTKHPCGCGSRCFPSTLGRKTRSCPTSYLQPSAITLYSRRNLTTATAWHLTCGQWVWACSHHAAQASVQRALDTSRAHLAASFPAPDTWIPACQAFMGAHLRARGLWGSVGVLGCCRQAACI